MLIKMCVYIVSVCYSVLTLPLASNFTLFNSILILVTADICTFVLLLFCFAVVSFVPL